MILSELHLLAPLIPKLVVPALTGLLASIVLEFLFMVPRNCIQFNRGSAGYLVHSASWISFFLVCLLLFQRPWFAVLLATSFQLLVLAVNFAKFRSLREPFILQDFEYFTDLIRHPGLYLPFFGIWNAVLGAVLFIALVSVALMLEDSVLATTGAGATLFFSVVASLLAVTLIAARFCAAGLPIPKLKPTEDIRAMGLYASFWCYYLAFRSSLAPEPRKMFRPDGGRTDAKGVKSADFPDFLVVQSESFFDPRLSYSAVRQDVLQHYDRIIKQSLCYGQLNVPAWGANTVRTESAFLTGLSPAKMGIHQFNPYWYLSRNALPNLVSKLKSQGYKTVCIHPYPVDFYRRNKVFPKLGFDSFIDLSGFNEDQKDGQYVSDAAVAEKVAEVIGQEKQPCFIFTITMENHGPLHLESDQGIDKGLLYSEVPPAAGVRDLTVYLRHLKNADQMLDRLTRMLSARERKSYLCWYGDHVPVMAQVYKTMGEPAAETPYLIWCSELDFEATQVQTLAADELALKLLSYSAPDYTLGVSDRAVSG
ncbi:MAG: LTA synthase family protein [Pontibacterium sp.]